MRSKSTAVQSVELKTNDERHSLHLTDFEILGKSIKCYIVMNSRGFSFEGAVYFDNAHKFIEELEVMNSELKGATELKEDYKDHYLRLELNELGHLIVSASFVEYSEHSQSLDLEFKTDQTCLPSFIEELKIALA